MAPPYRIPPLSMASAMALPRAAACLSAAMALSVSFSSRRPLDEAHGQHKERYVVAGLGGSLQVGDVVAGLYLGKIDSGELVLRLGMTGERGVAEVRCALSRMTGLERSSPELIFLLRLHHLVSGAENSTLRLCTLPCKDSPRVCSGRMKVERSPLVRFFQPSSRSL